MQRLSYLLTTKPPRTEQDEWYNDGFWTGFKSGMVFATVVLAICLAVALA